MTKFATLIRIAAVLAAIAGIQQLCVRPFRCLHILRDVEVSSKRLISMDEQAAAPIARSNLQRLQEVHGGCRTEIDYYVLLGINSAFLKRHDDALRYFAKGLEVDERPEIYFNRGMEWLEMQRIDEASAEFATAVEFNAKLLDSLSGELQERVRAEMRRRIEERQRRYRNR